MPGCSSDFCCRGSGLFATLREWACELGASPDLASGDVVQLVRTLPCHGRGRGFESRRPRHSMYIFGASRQPGTKHIQLSSNGQFEQHYLRFEGHLPIPLSAELQRARERARFLLTRETGPAGSRDSTPCERSPRSSGGGIRRFFPDQE